MHRFGGKARGQTKHVGRVPSRPFLVGALVMLCIAAWIVPTFASALSSGAGAAGGAGRQWFGIAATADGNGYWVVSTTGEVEAFGDAAPHGDASSIGLNRSIVGMASTPDGGGYWLDAGDGGIFAYGDAGFWGSTGSLRLNQPVVGMAPTRDGRGYWLVASDGGIFAFGDAPFVGSMGGHRLNKPIVAMVPTHDGGGYWLVASDGGIFAFGDAPFEGSLGSSPPGSPVVYMAPTPDNNGYWMVGQNGDVYPFGDAAHDGSLTGWPAPATSLAATPSGGYWVLTADGAVHPFGSARSYGSPASGPIPASGPSNVGGPAAVSTSTVSVNALTPSSGTAGGGDTVQISGSGFTGATAVDFGANASSDFTVNSDTSITTVAPVGSGTVDVRVVTSGETSTATSTDRFTYLATGQLPITARGQSLEIGGAPTLFTGFNAYQLATDWGTNAGCGGMATSAQIDSFFASLRPNSLVRFWAFQGAFATNIATHRLDWRPLDNIFYAAAKHHVYLIPTISDQAGTCDGGTWQGPSWYSGGFMNVYNSTLNSDGRGLTPLSYWDYMNALVSRYADSPALGMWEPMSEAEASSCPAAYEPTNCSGHQTCPDQSAAANALTYYFTTVGAEIRKLDPVHLIESGLLGGSQCGMNWTYFQTVSASPGIDVLSVHDYYGSASMGGDQWSGLALRFAQAKSLGKPIITGEVGIIAGNGQPGCESLQQRASDMTAKMNAQFAAGDSAFLVWDWVLDPIGPCNYNTGPADSALLSAVASIAAGG